ncbi:T9SS type B sorting domain-containing protein [Empedobacter falsenii]
MKHIYSIIFFLIYTIFSFANTLGFEKNIGQIVNQNNIQNTSVLYTLKLDGFNVNLNKIGFNYDFYEDENNVLKTHRIEFEFKNYNPKFKIIQSNQIDYFENYIYKCEDLTINFYKKIIYKNFYSNIDLEFYVNNNSDKPFEYNFVLHPGANINDIKFDIKGAKEKLNANQLEIKLRYGDLVESLPKSWIEHTNKSEIISIEYCYHQNGSIGLQANQNINNKKVIVDPLPIRKWGSYYATNRNSKPGSSYNNVISIKDVKFTNDNDIIAVGFTNLMGLATTGTFQQTISNGVYQNFITKFNNKGDRIWTTYYGASMGDEYSTFLDLDNNDNIYYTFETWGNNRKLVPTDAYQPNKNGASDFLILKLDKNGNRVWATFFGGNMSDSPYDLSVDKKNNVLYVGGQTMSSDLVFPNNALFKENDKKEVRGLIAKFDLDGKYIWSSLTYTRVHKIKSDKDGNIIISDVYHPLHENSPQYSSIIGSNILSKFSSNLDLIWSAQYGDTTNSIFSSSYIEGLDFDSQNNIVLSGGTRSKNGISTPDAYAKNYLFKDYLDMAGFIMKFDKNGNKLHGTYVGEKNFSYLGGLAIGNNDEIIVSGNANDKSKIEYGPSHFSSNIENRTEIDWNGNGLIMKFSPKLQPIWGFLYGDYSRSTRFQGVDYNKTTNEIIVGGWTTSEYMISTPNSFQKKPAKYNDIDNSMQDNGVLVLFTDNTNNFKIEKTGNDCEFSSLLYQAYGADSYEWSDIDGNIYSNSSIFKPTKIGQYICKFTKGVEVGYISIYVKEASPTIPPTPILPILPKITSYCFVNLDKPKALTSCGDEIEGTTDKTEFNEPGIYQVSWTYTDKFGNTSEQTQEIEVLAVDNFLNTEPIIQVCENDGHKVYELTSIENSFNITEEVKFEYFENITDLTNNLPITNPKSYINSQELEYVYIKGILANGCSNYTKIHLKIKPKPIANILEKILCDASLLGYVNVILNQYNLEINPNSSSIITYYSDENYINKVEKLDIIDNQKIYVVVEENGCINKSIILFKLSNYTLISSPPFEICKDNSSIGIFDLNSKSAEIASLLSVNNNDVLFFETLENAKNNQNPIIRNYENKNNLTKLYATSISTNACKTFVEIPLIENINPIIHIDTTYYKCKNSSIDIDLEENYDHINWSTGETNKKSISISKPGEYSVTVTNGNCSITKKIVVNDYSDLNIEYKYDGKQVHFTILNDLNAQISLDGINYTSNFSFTLEQGEHTFYFKSSNDCIEIRKIYLYKDLPSILTPNGDGKNDIWDLSYINDLINVKIFNRFGRTIFEATKDNQPIKWDGKYQLRNLPTDTYWYIIDLENGKKIQGSILIKNK